MPLARPAPSIQSRERGGRSVGLLTFDQMIELILLVAGHRLGGVEVREADFHFRVSAQSDGAAAAIPTAPAMMLPIPPTRRGAGRRFAGSSTAMWFACFFSISRSPCWRWCF